MDSNQKVLFSTPWVAGYRHYKGIILDEDLRTGDEIKLNRDPYNCFDRFAVEVFTSARQKLGFLPRKENQVAAFLLDNGIDVFAEIREIVRNNHPWQRMRLNLYYDGGGILKPKNIYPSETE